MLEHFGPLSDVDVAVLLDVEAEASVLRASLSHHLASILPNAAVDVVILNQAPIELAYAVISQGLLLYQRTTAHRVEYEARVLGLYGDYLPVLRQQRRIQPGGKPCVAW